MPSPPDFPRHHLQDPCPRSQPPFLAQNMASPCVLSTLSPVLNLHPDNHLCDGIVRMAGPSQDRKLFKGQAVPPQSLFSAAYVSEGG